MQKARRNSTVKSFRLHNSLINAMDLYASETGVSQAEQVRQGLKLFYAAKDGEFQSIRKRIAICLDAKER